MEYTTFKTDAIVIREQEIGEADKLFTLYTEKFGKIEVLGKGIRKIKAKLKGGLQILNYISLEFVKGKNFFIATDAVLKDDFFEMKKEIKTFRMGLYICALLSNLIKGEEKDEKIWKLSVETLNNLQPTVDILYLALRYFEWNILSYMGFRPELYHCIFCRGKVRNGKFHFSAKGGGLVCKECYERNVKDNLKKISSDTIKILRLVLSLNKNILKRLRIEKFQEKELKEISKYFLEYTLEKEIFIA